MEAGTLLRTHYVNLRCTLTVFGGLNCPVVTRSPVSGKCSPT